MNGSHACTALPVVTAQGPSPPKPQGPGDPRFRRGRRSTGPEVGHTAGCWAGQARPGAPPRAAAGEHRPQSGVELGLEPPAHQRAWRLALPLSGGRCQEPLTRPEANLPEARAGGLGWGRAGRGPDRR
jgi:hypothetical protein